MVKGHTFLFEIGFKQNFLESKSLVIKSARKFCMIYFPRTQMKSQNLAYFPHNCIHVLLCENIALTEAEL